MIEAIGGDKILQGIVETRKILLSVRPWEIAVFEVQGKEAESLKETKKLSSSRASTWNCQREGERLLEHSGPCAFYHFIPQRSLNIEDMP